VSTLMSLFSNAQNKTKQNENEKWLKIELEELK
jgi:hypothetical protein